MCGICGIVLKDRSASVDAAALERMNAALTHRGPDDAGQYTGPGVSLAARRLSIIDIPGGHQPVTNEDDTIIAVFNGEIYNFRELRRRLEQKDHVFKTNCDTEVLVHAYEEWGDDLVDVLDGMFAFAIYDKPKHRLLLARDRLGIKPLHYIETDRGLFFASELRALHHSGYVPASINPAALDAYFTYLYIPAPDTIFQNVHKLRPAERLVFEKGALKAQHYWRLQFNIDSKWNLDSAAERFKELLLESIDRQRISDVPLGAFLSGGIDSAVVVATLSKISAEPVKTFSIGFDDTEANELPYARAVAERFHTEHVDEICRPGAVELLPEIVRHCGEPFADSSVLPTWHVSKLARKRVTVALSGDGGDELFAGYAWTHTTRRVDAYRRVPRTLRNLVDIAVHLAPQSPFVMKLRRFSRDAFRSPIEAFRHRQLCFSISLRAPLYTPAWRALVSGAARDRFWDYADASSQFANPNRYLYQDHVMYLPDDILTKVDRMSMAHSLEVRVPLLDRRIVEFAATVPFHLKHRRSISKRVPKHAFRNELPLETLAQRKRGFAIPIQNWFRTSLRPVFEDTIFAGDARCATYLDREYIQSIFDSHQENRENYGHHLWAILVFEHWLREWESWPGGNP